MAQCTPCTDDDVDVGLWGLQEKSATSQVMSKSYRDDILRLGETMKWREVEETWLCEDFRKDGKVGDQSSHLNLPLERSKSPEGPHEEGKVGDKSGERGLPDDTQKHPEDENATCLALSEERRTVKENTTVPNLLETQSAVPFDSSFGVELILEDMSLKQEMKEKVMVKPEIRYVTCSHERDTSR